MPDESVDEWILKADEDYHFALAGMRQRKYPPYASVCFHSQQCAEKYIKAFLVRHNMSFRKTHDLDEILRLCIRVDATFGMISDLTPRLNPYAVEVRYPGQQATLEEARAAVAVMKQVRQFVRARLGLKTK